MELHFDIKPMQEWEKLFKAEIEKNTSTLDPSHDLSHLERVVATAKKLASQENANLDIVVPAAWLHDFVTIPKDSPLRKQASQISARRAIEFLDSINYPPQFHSAIAHAIESHSFSAQIGAQTLEAKIVQDADRLDALGAIGIARCFITSGRMNSTIESSVEHFYEKLFVIAETLHTTAAQIEGRKRSEFMRIFLTTLDVEKE